MEPTNSNENIIKWAIAAVLIAVAVFFVVSNYQKESAEPGLVAWVGDYKIFQSDIDDKIAFEKCLNRDLDQTRALGNLLYFGFLENVRQPLKADVTQVELDKEYDTLQSDRRTSFMSIDKKAFGCLNDYFNDKRTSFDKVVIIPPLLEASVQKAFTPSPTDVPRTAESANAGVPGIDTPPDQAVDTAIKNVFGTEETFYDWYVGYLKANVKVQIYSPQICSDVKSLYGDAWFKDLISCQ